MATSTKPQAKHAIHVRLITVLASLAVLISLYVGDCGIGAHAGTRTAFKLLAEATAKKNSESSRSFLNQMPAG